jgi:hypothetical protein
MKTLIGLSSEVVDVHYATDDGIIYGMWVTFNGIDVTGILSLDQYNDLEMECYANERKLEKERSEA